MDDRELNDARLEIFRAKIDILERQNLRYRQLIQKMEWPVSEDRCMLCDGLFPQHEETCVGFVTDGVIREL